MTNVNSKKIRNKKPNERFSFSLGLLQKLKIYFGHMVLYMRESAINYIVLCFFFRAKTNLRNKRK